MGAEEGGRGQWRQGRGQGLRRLPSSGTSCPNPDPNPNPYPNPNPNPNPQPDPNPNPNPNPRQVAESVSGRVEVKNFHNSWSNGLAFCALINAYNPELLDFSSLDAKNKLDNLKLAFSLAETQMGIPCFLDADDMISVRPDEKSVMTYASLPSASVGSGQ